MKLSSSQLKKLDLLAEFINNLGVATAAGGVLAVLVVMTDITPSNNPEVIVAMLVALASIVSGIFCHLIAREVVSIYDEHNES